VKRLQDIVSLEKFSPNISHRRFPLPIFSEGNIFLCNYDVGLVLLLIFIMIAQNCAVRFGIKSCGE